MSSRKIMGPVWTLLLLSACLAPGYWLHPWENGIHLGGSHFDKLVHGVLFAGFGYLWTRSGRSRNIWGWVFAVGLALAILTELGFPATGNSYFASTGSSLEYDATQTGGPPNGIFFDSGTVNMPPTSLAGVTDGLSNTIAFGEWKPGQGNQGVVSVPQDVQFLPGSSGGFTQNTPSMTLGYANMSGLMTWLNSCKTGGTRGPRSVTLGQYWAVGLPMLTMGNVTLGPNPKYTNCAFLNSYNSAGVYTLSSYHSGGCNVVLGDGSVRFLKSSVNLITLWALGSRAQGEVISADSF